MAETITSLLNLARAGGEPADGRALDGGRLDALAQLPATHRARVRLDRRARSWDASDADSPWRRGPCPPVLENAARFGTRRAGRVRDDRRRTGWSTSMTTGPGLEAGDPDSAFAPGYTTGDGAGSACPLSRRIARSGGGDVTLGTAPAGWVTRFTVSLPRVLHEDASWTGLTDAYDGRPHGPTA